MTEDSLFCSGYWLGVYYFLFQSLSPANLGKNTGMYYTYNLIKTERDPSPQGTFSTYLDSHSRVTSLICFGTQRNLSIDKTIPKLPSK